MKKSIYRAICFLFAILVVAMCFPFSAFAVDPVSAGVMANAFAQAIAAYGASNGVAMTFDVASTDGIGEAVHDLWKEFRNGTQEADDYATLAAALFPELYYKASSAVGAASDVYTVGYNISSTYAEEFDNFYNWLLSGPAEMVQVDNQYYQFSQSQIGPSASSIIVGSVSGFPNQPLYTSVDGATWQQNYNNGTVYWRGHVTSGTPYDTGNSLNVRYSTPYPAYAFIYNFDDSGSSSYVWQYAFVSTGAARVQVSSKGLSSYTGQNIDLGLNSTYNIYLATGTTTFTKSSTNFHVDLPVFPSLEAGVNAAKGYLDGTLTGDSIGVKASTNTGVAEFPDTADPNYDALHRAKEIPSSIPWDDALYGDGTGTLTDAQKEAIAEGVDGVIAEDGELTLAGEDAATDEPGTDDPPSSDPDDYQVVGLADLFPFCIPFDIYNFLSALAATPVAPHFTCTLNFPAAIGGQQTIDIDFDAPTWNQLAQLLRLLELLAFIVGLALLTRSMFIRG